MLTYGRDASLSYILGTSIDCRTHNVYVFSINDIRRKKKITNKSKVEINKHTKKYYGKEERYTAPYNGTWFTTWPSKFETENKTCDICMIETL